MQEGAQTEKLTFVSLTCICKLNKYFSNLMYTLKENSKKKNLFKILLNVFLTVLNHISISFRAHSFFPITSAIQTSK